MTTVIEQYPLEPDWVMFGVQHLNGVVLLASKDLSRAQLETEVVYKDAAKWYDSINADDMRIVYRITAELRGYVRIEAPDYPTALRRLLEIWSPPGRMPSIALPPAPASTESDDT